MMANGRIKDMAGNNEGAPGLIVWSHTRCYLHIQLTDHRHAARRLQLGSKCQYPSRLFTRKKSVFEEWSGRLGCIRVTATGTTVMLLVLRYLRGIGPVQETWPSICNTPTFKDCQQISAPFGHRHRPSCVQSPTALHCVLSDDILTSGEWSKQGASGFEDRSNVSLIFIRIRRTQLLRAQSKEKLLCLYTVELNFMPFTVRSPFGRDKKKYTKCRLYGQSGPKTKPIHCKGLFW
jgi:hypothetical protein